MEDEDITDMVIDSRDIEDDDLTIADLRNKKIKKELKRYYTKSLSIEVKDINKQKYMIRIRTIIRTMEYGSNFYYKWDNTSTLEANIKEIKYRIEKEIVSFFKVNKGIEF